MAFEPPVHCRVPEDMATLWLSAFFGNICYILVKEFCSEFCDRGAKINSLRSAHENLPATPTFALLTIAHALHYVHVQ